MLQTENSSDLLKILITNKRAFIRALIIAINIFVYNCISLKKTTSLNFGATVTVLGN